MPDHSFALAADGPHPLAWTRVGLGVAAIAYALLAGYGLLFLKPDLMSRGQEVLVAATCITGFAIHSRRPHLASLVTLIAIWAEISLSVFQNGGSVSISMLGYPILVSTFGLLLGANAAVQAAIASAVAVPALVVAHRLSNGGGPLQPSDIHHLLSFGIATVGTAVLVRAALTSYGRILARSEADRSRFLRLFEEAMNGLLAIGPDGRIIRANAAARQLLAQPAEALVGLTLPEALARAGARGGPAAWAAGSAIELARASGTRTVEISSRAPSAGTAVDEALVVLLDVTQRRLVEERLGHAQRLETVGQLAGGIAHDFNNLLAAVGGNASLLLEHADRVVRELAAEIAEAQQRGAALVRQLLAFARRDQAVPESIDLSQAVAGLERLLARLLGENHRVEVLCPAAPVPVLANRAQLEQVAVNLVVNARDAMPGGGRVRVAIRELDAGTATALGSMLLAPRQALLEVADDGMGMTPEVRARAFEPFFSTKPRGQGTGLGLATVHGIVTQGGGCVAVDSAPGRGTRMRVFLPRCDTPLATAAPSPSAAPVRGSEPVLLVEDDPGVRALALRVLDRAGYAVTSAVSGEEAIRLAMGRVLSLVVSDVVMPGLSGPALVRRLRETRPGLPAVFMSGYQEIDAGELEELEPDRLLKKPFAPEELLSRVRSLLQPGPVDVAVRPRR